MLNNVFTGKEVEGPERGRDTIFVKRSATTNEVIKALATKSNISRVYFGAGNERGITEEQLFLAILLNGQGYDIWVEVDKESVMPSDSSLLDHNDFIGIQFVYVLEKAPKMKIHAVKFLTNKEVFWLQIEDAVVSSLDDPLYLEDK